jgi:hypothetical protein
VPEPGHSLSDAEVARELDAIRSRLAALSERRGRDVAHELVGIRETLRRLAEDNADIRARLDGSGRDHSPA